MTTYATPNCSQVGLSYPGSGSWTWLGSIGHVTALKYSFAMPPGCDKLSCTLEAPAAYRNQAFDPGLAVSVRRGGHQVWSGRLQEPAPGPDGWSFTAVGDGQRGQDFNAVYTGTWPSGQPDDAINEAISRGMPWVNPGIGTPAWAWYGSAQNSGSQTIGALLDGLTTRGTGTYYANSQPGGLVGTDISLFQIPSVVNRLLVVTTPVARTLGNDVNRIHIYYQVTADNSTTGATATYALTSVQNSASIAAHQAVEAYLDLSSSGVMSAAAAQAVGQSLLSNYQRASYAGPFTAAPGQLLTAGGVPIDPGTEQAGTVIRALLTDYGYGGEVAPGPVTFPVGAYEWDDMAEVATITPFQTLNQSFSGLLSMEQTVLQQLTTTST